MDGIQRKINLFNFLTPVSRDNADVQAVTSTETVEMQAVWDALCDIFCNQYIQYMTEYGLGQWEGIFSVLPKAGDTFDDRRNRILILLAGSRPYTLEKFQEILDGLFGAGNITLYLDCDKYQIRIDVSADGMHRCNDVRDLAEIIVPKNLIIDISNTKNGQISLYACAVMTRLKHYVIKPSKSFNLTEIRSSAYTAGTIKRRVHYIVK